MKTFLFTLFGHTPACNAPLGGQLKATGLACTGYRTTPTSSMLAGSSCAGGGGGGGGSAARGTTTSGPSAGRSIGGSAVASARSVTDFDLKH